MKALVLDQEDGLVTVLREDGNVLRLRQDWAEGETVELPAESGVLPFPRKRRRWLQAAVAAALVFTLMTGTYTYTTAVACSYVSVDAEDASVELAVNRLSRVIEVRAVNAESQELARDLNDRVKDCPVEEALDRTVELMKEGGRLTDPESPVIAGVTDGNLQRSQELVRKVEEALDGQGDLHTVTVTPEEREEAQKRELGGGRFVFEQREAFPPPVSAGEPTSAPQEIPAQGEPSQPGAAPQGGQPAVPSEAPEAPSAEQPGEAAPVPPEKGEAPFRQPDGRSEAAPAPSEPETAFGQQPAQGAPEDIPPQGGGEQGPAPGGGTAGGTAPEGGNPGPAPGGMGPGEGGFPSR